MLRLIANLRRIMAFQTNGATEVMKNRVEQITKAMDTKIAELQTEGTEESTKLQLKIQKNREDIGKMLEDEDLDRILEKEADKATQRSRGMTRDDNEDLISTFIQRELFGQNIDVFGSPSSSTTPFKLIDILEGKHRDGLWTVTKGDIEAIWTNRIQDAMKNYVKIWKKRRTDISMDSIRNEEGEVVELSTGVDDTMKELLEKEKYCSTERNLNNMLNDMSKFVVKEVIVKNSVDEFGESKRTVDKFLMACFRNWIKTLRGRSNVKFTDIKNSLLNDRNVKRHIPENVLNDKTLLNNLISNTVQKLRNAIERFLRTEMTEQQAECWKDKMFYMFRSAGRRTSKVARRIQAKRDKAVRYMIAAYILGEDDVFKHEGYDDPKAVIESILTDKE